MKRCHEGPHICSLIIVSYEFFFASAGQVNNLERGVGQRRQRFNHGLIDSARALAAAHDQKGGSVAVQAEFLAGELAINPPQIGPDRRPRDLCFHSWKKWRAFFEAE